MIPADLKGTFWLSNTAQSRVRRQSSSCSRSGCIDSHIDRFNTSVGININPWVLRLRKINKFNVCAWTLSELLQVSPMT